MRKKVLTASIIALLAGALVWSLFIPSRESGHALRASGMVEATEARLGFTTAGRIEKVYVREGDLVEAGDTLASLDSSETQARLRRAKARVETAKARLRETEEGARPEEIEQASAVNRAAEERLDDARRDYKRAQHLFDNGAISREALDKAGTALDIAASEYHRANEALLQLERGRRREVVEAQRAMLAEAEADLSTFQVLLSNMVIRAPFDGIISVRHHEPGETVTAGSPVLTLQDRNDRWVRIYVPEQRIGAVHISDSATITTDAFPEKRYPGKVVFISSEAEFTPKTVQTPEERIRLVYAVKVRVSGDDSYDLKPGMPADVEVHLRQ
jgi:HlyD family secretion protein